MVNEFKAALDKARQELATIEQEEKRLAARKSQLLQSIAGLASLCGESAGMEATSLADAIRTVYRNTYRADPKRGLTPRQARDSLISFGFDLAPFKNQMASIHTAIQRMIQAGELKPYGDPDIGGYIWVEPTPGELKRRLQALRGASSSFESGWINGFGEVPPKKG